MAKEDTPVKAEDEQALATRSPRQPTPAGTEEGKIWVVSTRTDGRVVLWEVDDAHPGGEVFIAGPVPALAHPTADVNLALRNGELREATSTEIEKRKRQLRDIRPNQGYWDE